MLLAERGSNTLLRLLDPHPSSLGRVARLGSCVPGSARRTRKLGKAPDSLPHGTPSAFRDLEVEADLGNVSEYRRFEVVRLSYT